MELHYSTMPAETAGLQANRRYLMGTKNDRVILIKGDASKWYDQAIFIVNKNIPPDKIPVDFVAEAEKIINQYIMKKNRQAGHPKNTEGFLPPSMPAKAVKPVKDKRFDFALNMIMLLGCLAIASMFIFGMFG